MARVAPWFESFARHSFALLRSRVVLQVVPQPVKSISNHIGATMGVQDLWSIVEPVRESVPLYSLSGKTLAVDLSLWVCEAQHVQAMMGRVTKPHLRQVLLFLLYSGINAII